MSVRFNMAMRLTDLAFNNFGKEGGIAPHILEEDRIYYKRHRIGRINLESEMYAWGMHRAGIRQGMKVLLMVPFDLDFVAIIFAMFKMGAIPVFIDPGMGFMNIGKCIRHAKPEAMIAVPQLHIARFFLRQTFWSVKIQVSTGPRISPFTWRIQDVRKASHDTYKMAETTTETPAAIVFTSGATGVPKGVIYTHGLIDAQVDALRMQYGFTMADIDLAAFPLFSILSIALGMQVIFPIMNFTKPATVNPERIVEAIQKREVTTTFGSPAIWRRVSKYCVENEVKLPTLRRVLMAGAPVEVDIHERLLNNGILAKNGMTFTPYGATEALPVCDIKGNEILKETAALTKEGKGVCVGYPVFGMSVEIIKLTDEAIETWDDSLKMPVGEIGEITVSGPTVTTEYYNMPEQTRLAKIRNEKTGALWHRMGDLGYKDEKGRIWFVGRKSHRVQTKDGLLYPIPCETIFNRHKEVTRTALVGVGKAPNQIPVIIAEISMPRKELKLQKQRLTRELLEIGAQSPVTSGIKHVLFHKKFPVDGRHNAKIYREKLKRWADWRRPDLSRFG